LGLAGFALGAYIGGHQGRNCSCDGEGGLEQAFYGAAIGGTAGMALGIHLGNRRRGNFLIDFVTAGAIWGGGMALGSALHWRGEAPLIILTGIPIAQLAITTSVERANGRAHDRESAAATVRILPAPGGGMAAISLPLPPIH
jgi:hypothetical protein